MKMPRVISTALLGFSLLGADATGQSNTMAAGSRVRVTLTDGVTYTGTIAPKPQNPLWQFVTLKGAAVNYRLDQVISVRLVGRDERITPSWPSAPLTLPIADVHVAGGALQQLGIYRWPSFEIAGDGPAGVRRSADWHAQGPVTLRQIEAVGADAGPSRAPDFEFAPVPPAKPKPQGGRP